MRISGTERLHGKELLTLEKRVGGALTQTELINVDDARIHRYRRTNADGKSIVSDSPQTLVPAPLQIGAKMGTGRPRWRNLLLAFARSLSSIG